MRYGHFQIIEFSHFNDFSNISNINNWVVNPKIMGFEQEIGGSIVRFLGDIGVLVDDNVVPNQIYQIALGEFYDNVSPKNRVTLRQFLPERYTTNYSNN